MKEAIQKAIEGGYLAEAYEHFKTRMKNPDENIIVHIEKWENDYFAYMFGGTWNCSTIFLDPLFWQALGKSLGWRGEKKYINVTDETFGKFETWECYWHRFIDHLASGKDAESFFQELLANK